MLVDHLFSLVLASGSSSDSLDFTKVSPPLAAAAAIAIATWLLLLGAFALFTRPKAIEAAEPTMDLGPEPPAVADYLVNMCRATAHAIPGTLVDLAARHYVQIEEYGATDTLVRIHRDATPDLTPYEKQVLEQVASLAENGVVPLQALTLGTQGRVERWRSSFDKEVAKDAKARGLSEDRWSLKTWTILRFAGFVAGALVVGVATQAGSFEAGLFVAIMAAAGAHTALLKVFGTQKLTPAGYAAASHWLGVREYMAHGQAFNSLPAGSVVLWDRYMAYAAVFGLARATLASMPMGAEDDHHAWSAYGGSWHQVRVRYPQTHIVWGRTPLGAAFVGLVIIAIGAAIAWLMLQLHGVTNGYHDQIALDVRIASVLLAIGGALLVVWGAATMRLAFADLGARRELDGEVVRCRVMPRGQNDHNYWAAVDDGSSLHLKAWLLDRATYDRLHEGDVVHASLSRNLAHVYKIDVTKATRQVDLPAEPQSTAGAGASSGPAAFFKIEASAIAPEALVTAEDAAAALGAPVKPAQELDMSKSNERLPMALPHGCFYAAQSGGNDGVFVAAACGPMVNTLMRIFARRSGDAVEVPSGQAYIHGNAVALLAHDTAVMITLRGGSGDAKAALAQLATCAAQRLSGPAAGASADAALV
ncbi:MAG TPA: hypothetical protein VFY10_09545 [Dehalococcoidia bacterium]|nr:hypothetical protein [Dehalococcoidia bacterium]